MKITFTPYYLIMFVFFISLIKPYNTADENWKKTITNICLLTLIIFFGFRGAVGPDYHHYLSYYQHSTPENTMIFGPGYALINWIFTKVHLPFQCLLFFFSTTTNLLLMIFWNRTKKNIPFIVSIFFALGGIINEIDFIRNFFSLSLFVISTKYIEEERNASKYFIINIIGILFHYSSLLYLPLFWICKKNIKRGFYISCLIIGFIFGTFHVPILDFIPRYVDDSLFPYLSHLYNYIELYEGIKISFSIGTIEMLVTSYFIVVLYKKINNTTLGKIGTIAFLCFFMSYNILSNYAVLATRLSNMFIFSYWIIWPLFVEYLSTKRTKFYAYVLMFTYMSLRLLSISFLPQWKYCLCF